MTTPQRLNFYFPAWRRCAQANSWQMVHSRLLAALDEQQVLFAGWPDPAGPLALQVINTAANLAHHQHRAATAEDLRHACNSVASAGRTLSSGKLTNAEVSRVVTLFNLLADPWNIAAVMAWGNPAAAEKNALLAALRRAAPDHVISSIALNAFDHRRYADLDPAQLRWLLKTIKAKNHGRTAAPVEQSHH